jgi:hypothetical protein
VRKEANYIAIDIGTYAEKSHTKMVKIAVDKK